MLDGKDKLIKSSRWAVRIATWANGLFLIAVSLGLLLSCILRTPFATLLIQQRPGNDVHSEMTGLRLLMLLGGAMAVATGFLLAALTQIIASAGEGDPFIAANAPRLRSIGWSLLALQLLDIPGDLLQKFFPSLGSGAPDVTFSPGGWLAVLMVFVLSRVFAAGTAMRNDLEGTV